jgi:hypothetical protein
VRVLITNRVLDGRSGTETYTRDLALGLLRTGHAPVVFATRLGELADEIRGAAIPVVDDLASVGGGPDVIHGHHSVETLAAVARFPGVPALFVCHDASAWYDTPPRHPRIRRYVAVDEGCRERVAAEAGVPVEACALIPNAVDLERFRARPPLPAQPRRALAYGHVLAPAELVAIERACRARGIALERAGSLVGSALSAPEHALGGYDLVFAKGRCALEALAVGAAVVVCGPGGVASLVTSDSFDALRPLNFGRRSYRLSFDEESLGAQIDRYDAADAGLVSRRARAVARLDALTAALVEVYEAIAEEERAAPASAQAESDALAANLSWLARCFEEGVRREGRRRYRARVEERRWTFRSR